MLFEYGFSILGKNHAKHGIECQDHHRIIHLSNGSVVGVVADGVGAAKNAAIGSKTAVEAVAEYFPRFFDPSFRSNKYKENALREAFRYALKKIIFESEERNEPLNSFDTTLTAAIFDGYRISYAHSGDGGIFGLRHDGKYVEITCPQKALDGVSLIPLRAGPEYWEVGSCSQNFLSVLLATDGIRNVLCPSILDSKQRKMYLPMLSFYMDPHQINCNHQAAQSKRSDILNFAKMQDEEVYKIFYTRISAIYRSNEPKRANQLINQIKESRMPIILMMNEGDDKTAVAFLVVNKKKRPLPNFHYQEPDWILMSQRYLQLLYPTLYGNERSESNEIIKGQQR